MVILCEVVSVESVKDWVNSRDFLPYVRLSVAAVFVVIVKMAVFCVMFEKETRVSSRVSDGVGVDSTGSCLLLIVGLGVGAFVGVAVGKKGSFVV